MTHTDEARRIVDEFVRDWLKSEQPVGTTQERLTAVIAAALAAERRKAIEEAASVLRKRADELSAVDADGNCRDIGTLVGAAILVSAPLPESSGISGELPAEPAAKCATCLGVGHVLKDPETQSRYTLPCPSCGGGS